MAQWIRTSIAKEPYSFVFFPVGGPDPLPPPPLDPRMVSTKLRRLMRRKHAHWRANFKYETENATRSLKLR